VKPDGLRLFWSIPPRGQRSRPDLRRAATGDWLNLETSGAPGVMLPLGLAWAQPGILMELAAAGKRVILRILDDDLVGAANQVITLGKVCPVELVIVRNEPDAPYDLTWGHDWGNKPGGPADVFRSDLARAAGLNWGGAKVASGALSCRNFREDDPPQPGLFAWAEAMRPAANRMLNAGHAYTYTWRSDVDRISIKNRLQLMAGIHHSALVLSELGINDTGMPQPDKASAYVEIMQWLSDAEWPTGDRYVMAIPFLSTGSDEWRKAGYLLDDPEVYRRFGDFVK
jgi:hypothetical protein